MGEWRGGVSKGVGRTGWDMLVLLSNSRAKAWVWEIGDA